MIVLFSLLLISNKRIWKNVCVRHYVGNSCCTCENKLFEHLSAVPKLDSFCHLLKDVWFSVCLKKKSMCLHFLWCSPRFQGSWISFNFGFNDGAGCEKSQRKNLVFSWLVSRIVRNLSVCGMCGSNHRGSSELLFWGGCNSEFLEMGLLMEMLTRSLTIQQCHSSRKAGSTSVSLTPALCGGWGGENSIYLAAGSYGTGPGSCYLIYFIVLWSLLC